MNQILVINVDYGEELYNNTYLLYQISQHSGMTMTETMDKAQELVGKAMDIWRDQDSNKTLDEFIEPLFNEAGILAKPCEYTLQVIDA